MLYDFSTQGFPTPPDLAEFARVTALFEVWRPRLTLDRLVVAVRRTPGPQDRYRCDVLVRKDEETVASHAIASDAYDAVRYASALLRDRFGAGPFDDRLRRPTPQLEPTATPRRDVG